MTTRRALIVEDNETKRKAIEAVLKSVADELGPNQKLEVSQCRTIASAYAVLASLDFDIIVLDMAFQEGYGAARDGWLPPLAGLEVLQQLQRKRTRSKVIVATQHGSFSDVDYPAINTLSDLDTLLTSAFPSLYRGFTQVDLAEVTWQHKLGGLIRKVLYAPQA